MCVVGVCMYCVVTRRAYVYTIRWEGYRWMVGVFLGNEQLGVGGGCPRGGYSNLTGNGLFL